MGGNDTLDSGFGNDTLDGGTGTDTANVGFARADSRVAFGSTAQNMIIQSSLGLDTLRNMEEVAFSDGTVSTTLLAKVFSDPALGSAAFGYSNAAGGWSSDNLYHRELADVNGDGRADIVGFGGDATYAALATSGGAFTPAALAVGSFGYSTNGGGWATNDKYPRMLADVTGDGNADIVGFGETGAFVAQYNDWFYV